MGLKDRLRKLESTIEPVEDEGEVFRRALLREVMEEIGRLKASRAVRYRGGARIEPQDIPGKILGPDYTTGEMVGLAARRVVEREFAEDLDADRLEEAIEDCTHVMHSVFERIGMGERWDLREGGGSD